MQNRWFQSWRGQDALDCAVNGGSQSSSAPSPESANENKSVNLAEETEGFAASGTDLLVFEEIYRSAAIKGPKMGYNIIKIIEMLGSEHIRHMATETKRASLLMALEAAGVQVDEVLQDATLRQRAINTYESIQRKHLEEFEARKAQENCAIQAEMERVSAEYAARISNNLDEVSREKDSFRKWMSKKQLEAQRIAEAVALCVTQSGSKAGSDPMAPFREIAGASDPTFAHRG